MRRATVGALLGLCIGAPAAGQSLSTVGTIVPEADVRFTAIAPNGGQIAGVCRDRKLRLWALPAKRLVQTIDLGDMRVTSLAYSRNGARLAASGFDGAVRVFDTARGVLASELPVAPRRVDFVALSPDGGRLAIAPADLPVQLWDVAQRTQIAELPTHFAGATGLAFSPDGLLLATINSDTTVHVYDAASGRPRAAFDELDLEPLALDFAPDSKTLVVGGADKVLVALDPQTGSVRHRLARQPDPIGGLAILGDGKTVVATCFNADDMNQSRALLTWNMATGAVTTLATGKSFNGGGVAAGRLLLTSAGDGVLELWEVR